MSVISDLKNLIDQYITTNGNMEITGAVLNSVLDSIADAADGSIVSLTSNQDGTLVFTLADGDVITIDLNHDHTAYPKYVLCADEADYTAITTKESDTLYLIPE